LEPVARLELAGLDPYTAAPPVRFSRVVPVDLELYPKSTPDDLGRAEGFQWSRLRILPVDQASARRCLFALARIPRGDKAAVMRFVKEWGALRAQAFFNEAQEEFFANGAATFWEYFETAAQVGALLSVMAATEAGEAAPLASLEVLGWFHLPFLRDVRDEPEGLQALKDHRSAVLRSVLGVGDNEPSVAALQLQRDVVTSALPHVAGYAETRPVWDSSGRRMVRDAIGAGELMGAQLQAIFTAPLFQMAVCSVCGQVFDTSDRDRSPRSNVRRFCSDGCRSTGRRATLRASWHRNKGKYRKGGAA